MKNKTKEEKRAYWNNWYASQSDEYKSNKVSQQQKRIDENRQWLNELKAEAGCVLCGEIVPVVLDYHHVVPEFKELSISDLVNAGFSRERILKEIEKCILMCSNCHRKGHFGIIILGQ